MHHGLVDRVGCFIRENAGRQTRHHLRDSGQVAGVEDVVVDQHVLPEKIQVGTHVVEKAADLKQKAIQDK